MNTKELKSELIKIYYYQFKLGMMEKITGLTPVYCLTYPLQSILLKEENNKRILDFGSGSSLLPTYLEKEYFRRNNCKITCIDISKSIYKQKDYLKTINNKEMHHIDITLGTGLLLPFKDNSFDLIIAHMVIQHIPNGGDTETFREFNRVIKDGGKIYLTIHYGKSEYVNKGYRGRRWVDRYYTNNDILERLIYPAKDRSSELIILKEFYLVNKKSVIFKIAYTIFNKYLRLAFGWLYVLPMCLHITRYDANWSMDNSLVYLDVSKKNDAEIIMLILQKFSSENRKLEARLNGGDN